ncbi:hypothetical protein A0H81_12663 [Grifola frondosa]|uniref:Uncharacterized protein n=1 Tax=Grifola frondosa TaxID=5627 RepID=A0A1C7LRY1_GRIFR|nr:hypothetical protein A0H81_12663 [Grifola frondosa]
MPVTPLSVYLRSCSMPSNGSGLAKALVSTKSKPLVFIRNIKLQRTQLQAKLDNLKLLINALPPSCPSGTLDGPIAQNFGDYDVDVDEGPYFSVDRAWSELSRFLMRNNKALYAEENFKDPDQNAIARLAIQILETGKETGAKKASVTETNSKGIKWSCKLKSANEPQNTELEPEVLTDPVMWRRLPKSRIKCTQSRMGIHALYANSHHTKRQPNLKVAVQLVQYLSLLTMRYNGLRYANQIIFAFRTADDLPDYYSGRIKPAIMSSQVTCTIFSGFTATCD